MSTTLDWINFITCSERSTDSSSDYKIATYVDSSSHQGPIYIIDDDNGFIKRKEFEV